LKNYITVDNHLVRGDIFNEKDYENIMIIVDKYNQKYVVKKQRPTKIDRSQNIRQENSQSKIKVHFKDGTNKIYKNAREVAKEFGGSRAVVYQSARLNKAVTRGVFKDMRFEKMR